MSMSARSDKGELVHRRRHRRLQLLCPARLLHVIEDRWRRWSSCSRSSRACKMLRSWAGIVDVCAGRLPDHRQTPVEGLYLNGGWGTGGFKATPGSGWVFAHTIAHDAPHPLNDALRARPLHHRRADRRARRRRRGALERRLPQRVSGAKTQRHEGRQREPVSHHQPARRCAFAPSFVGEIFPLLRRCDLCACAAIPAGT